MRTSRTKYIMIKQFAQNQAFISQKDLHDMKTSCIKLLIIKPKVKNRKKNVYYYLNHFTLPPCVI